MLSLKKIFLLKTNLETRVFLFFSIVFFLAFHHLSHFTLWTETEIYPTHSSKYLFTEEGLNFLFSLKPIFHLVLYLSSLFSSLFSLLPITGARFLFALNGLLVLVLMYLYIKKKTSKYNAILAVLVLASANIFLDRGFRIRSDLLSSSFSLISLLITLNIKEKKDNWKFYIVIPLLFSLFLISPKGIYWFCFSLCLILYNLKHNKPSLWLTVKTVFAVYIVFYFLSFLLKDPLFFKAIYESTRFYLSNIKETLSFISEQGLIQNLSNFSHINFFIKRNLFLVMLIFVKALFIIYSIAITKKRKWDLSDFYFVLLLIILLFHPQQKLFFLSAILPFFLISFFTDDQWNQLLDHSYSLKFKTFLLAGAFLYSLSYISYFNYNIYVTKNNHVQKRLILKLNDFYKDTDPLISIFDPNCILYKRKTNCKYILDSINFTKFKKISKSYFQKYNFDLILASRSLNLFELIHYKQFSFQYINIKNHIYYKAFIVNLKGKKNLLKDVRFDLDDFSSIIKSNQENKKSIIPKNQLIQIQKKDLKQNEKLFKTAILSGKNILKSLLSSLQTKVPEKSRKYSYFFLDSQNKLIKKRIDCQKKRVKIPILLAGCPYSKEEFKKGVIPMEQGKLALFYLPIPLDLPENLSLRALFRYDLYF